jgi:TfoX C-terminal domain
LPTTAEWLHAIGIQTCHDPEDLGSVNAFQTIRAHGFNTSLLLLYALEGALLNIHWNHLPVELKSRLKSAVK